MTKYDVQDGKEISYAALILTREIENINKEIEYHKSRETGHAVIWMARKADVLTAIKLIEGK